jgi:hypothetical protein
MQFKTRDDLSDYLKNELKLIRSQSDNLRLKIFEMVKVSVVLEPDAGFSKSCVSVSNCLASDLILDLKNF